MKYCYKTNGLDILVVLKINYRNTIYKFRSVETTKNILLNQSVVFYVIS